MKATLPWLALCLGQLFMTSGTATGHVPETSALSDEQPCGVSSVEPIGPGVTSRVPPSTGSSLAAGASAVDPIRMHDLFVCLRAVTGTPLEASG